MGRLTTERLNEIETEQDADILIRNTKAMIGQAQHFQNNFDKGLGGKKVKLN